MSKKHRTESRAERAAAALLEQQRRERRRQLLVVGAVVAVIVAIAGVGFLVQSTRDTTGRAPSAVPAGVSDSYGVVVGDSSAPRTVTVYEDFQCPICHEFELATRTKLHAAVAAGKVRIDYRMVSFLDEASTTRYSSRALNAAAVVLDTSGKDVFQRFHDLLFTHQPAEGSAGLSDDELVRYAVRAGADESAVRPGIEGDQFHQWVANTKDGMSKAGVNGTPTVFVDGTKQDGSGLQASIDAALGAVG